MPEIPNPPSNSHKDYTGQEKSKAEKIVTGNASKAKKPMGKQMKEALVGDVEEVKSYLLWDVFIPAVKDTIVDLIKAFAEGVFHSSGSRQSQNSYIRREGGRSYVSYSSYSSPTRANTRVTQARGPVRGSYNQRYAYDFDGIVYESRQDAESVLNALAERTIKYGMASVADLYELSGIASSYTDTDWGWAEISNATVQRSRDGYVIDLPRPERLD